jgi:hypothetical protein
MGVMRRSLPPDRMHVTQTATLVSVEDSSGAVLEEIRTVSAAADTFMHAPGARRLDGRWNDGQLEAYAEGPRGNGIRQIYALQDGGATLVVRIQIEPKGSGPAREIKRVYRRAASS